MHQGQVWLSDGRIRAAGAHSPGLRRIRRSAEDLGKDRGSDDKTKYQNEMRMWHVEYLSNARVHVMTLTAEIFHHRTLPQDVTTPAFDHKHMG